MNRFDFLRSLALFLLVPLARLLPGDAMNREGAISAGLEPYRLSESRSLVITFNPDGSINVA